MSCHMPCELSYAHHLKLSWALLEACAMCAHVNALCGMCAVGVVCSVRVCACFVCYTRCQCHVQCTCMRMLRVLYALSASCAMYVYAHGSCAIRAVSVVCTLLRMLRVLCTLSVSCAMYARAHASCAMYLVNLKCQVSSVMCLVMWYEMPRAVTCYHRASCHMLSLFGAVTCHV